MEWAELEDTSACGDRRDLLRVGDSSLCYRGACAPSGRTDRCTFHPRLLAETPTTHGGSRSELDEGILLGCNLRIHQLREPCRRAAVRGLHAPAAPPERDLCGHRSDVLFGGQSHQGATV